MAFIKDPFDPEVALTEDGRLAGKMFLLPATPDGFPPTAADLSAGTFIGFTDGTFRFTELNAAVEDVDEDWLFGP